MLAPQSFSITSSSRRQFSNTDTIASEDACLHPTITSRLRLSRPFDTHRENTSFRRKQPDTSSDSRFGQFLESAAIPIVCSQLSSLSGAVTLMSFFFLMGLFLIGLNLGSVSRYNPLMFRNFKFGQPAEIEATPTSDTFLALPTSTCSREWHSLPRERRPASVILAQPPRSRTSRDLQPMDNQLRPTSETFSQPFKRSSRRDRDRSPSASNATSVMRVVICLRLRFKTSRSKQC
mmetsp:Transcript_24650/g.41668  ORF Transcript_24650/g.41668 Transcript_24650/m.41668 type:complete len:234 (-) Transcript_24650:831-1532(-)